MTDYAREAVENCLAAPNDGTGGMCNQPPWALASYSCQGCGGAWPWEPGNRRCPLCHASGVCGMVEIEFCLPDPEDME